MRLFNNVTAINSLSGNTQAQQSTDGQVVQSTGIHSNVNSRRLIKREGPSNQPHVSESEIRQKLESHLQRGKMKQQALNPEKNRETSTFMEEEEAVGDVGLNNPDNPVTVGKLKDILGTGGFNFSDKERNVLSQILKDR